MLKHHIDPRGWRRQARAEIAYAASFVEFYSEEAKRIEGGVLPGPTPSKRIMVRPQSLPRYLVAQPRHVASERR